MVSSPPPTSPSNGAESSRRPDSAQNIYGDDRRHLQNVPPRANTPEHQSEPRPTLPGLKSFYPIPTSADPSYREDPRSSPVPSSHTLQQQPSRYFEARQRLSEEDSSSSREQDAGSGSSPAEYAHGQASASGMVQALSIDEPATEAQEAPPPSLASFSLGPDAEPRTYLLRVAEEPAHGRLCGFTTRDRRMLDPTPIVALQILDRHGQLDINAMAAPHFLVQASITSADANDRTLVINPANDGAVRMVEGVQVQNGTYVSEDQTTYYAFPDLSVRLAGRYRLVFSLVRLGAHQIPPAGFRSSNRINQAGLPSLGAAVASVTSQEFEVYPPRRFPGVLTSTALARRLNEHGVKVHLRNNRGVPQ
ncbi:hypothetical protein OC845_004418 [Tilletia horrida]|nr:hypothetical protein OC845_004418 [Tilletia horrida]